MQKIGEDKTAMRCNALGVVLWILPAACIVLKLLISYLFPLSRFLLIALVPAAAVCLIIFLIANRRLLGKKSVLARSLLCCAAILFALLPIDSRLELRRFQVSKGAYLSAVQKVKQNLPPPNSTEPNRFPFQFPDTIANPYGWADCYRAGDSVAVLFPASESLSVTRYYAYFSDSTAKDLLEHPEKYGYGMRGVKRIDPLSDSHWGYVFTWGDEMTPANPYL